METLIGLQNLPFCALCVWNCCCVSVCVHGLQDRWGRRWHAYGQQLAVAAHSGHSARPTLVPGVLPTESQQRRRLCEMVDLLQTAAQVALLQQPEQLWHPAGLRVWTSLLDSGQRDLLVWNGELQVFHFPLVSLALLLLTHLSSSCRCLSPWSYCSPPQLCLSSTCSSYLRSSVIILGTGSSGT